MLKYSQLTKAQKKFICNGCGGKGGIIKPPNFIFKASCNHHDFKFWKGYLLEHFKKANKDFYKWMRQDIQDIPYSTHSKLYIRYLQNLKITGVKSYYHVWAFSYYQAVNIGGKKYFNFDVKSKTLEDLNKEMRNRDGN